MTCASCGWSTEARATGFPNCGAPAAPARQNPCAPPARCPEKENEGLLACLFSMFLEGRMPGQCQPLQHARGAVGELSQEGVDQDAEHDDVDLHEFAGLHRHVTEPG